jgi:hypothetical protein
VKSRVTISDLLKTETSNLEWLQLYYASCCDGVWEAEFGFALDTTDGPGWSFVCDLRGSALSVGETAPRQAVSAPRGIEAWVEDDEFHAECGVQGLDPMLGAFRAWAVARLLRTPA